MVSLRSVVLWLGVASLVTAGTESTLYGRIKGVPEELKALQENAPGSSIKVLNGLNFQSRIKATLTILNDTARTWVAPLNKDYEFEFDQLQAGNEYQLVVHAYDFILDVNRFRVAVSDSVVAFQESLDQESYNKSSAIAVDSPDTPLAVQIIGYKNYYETKLGSLRDMVMNSPFGFIFANTLYTVLFAVCCAIMVAPYILSWMAPEFAADFEEIRTTGLMSSSKVGQTTTQQPQPIENAGGRASGSNTGRGTLNARQRKS